MSLQPLHSHRAARDRVQSDFKKSMYIEIAVLGNLLMRLYPPTDMDGGPAENILPPFVFLIIPFTLP